MHGWHPCGYQREEPDPEAEVAVMQVPIVRAGEHEPILPRLGETAQVPLDHGNDHLRDRHDAKPGPGLGRPEGEPAGHLGELPDHPDGARVQVDVAPA